MKNLKNIPINPDESDKDYQIRVRKLLGKFREDDYYEEVNNSTNVEDKDSVYELTKKVRNLKISELYFG